ncbi:MAG: T9SS type A sorting domain-containing protein [Bacteroidia bacterium]|nr:T9SS type A sorting domain-containing protein [Bacteroidia bacterium]
MKSFPCFLFILLLTMQVVSAQPGSLDPSFGNGGTLTTDFFGKYDQISDVFLFPDGRIFAAGSARNASGNDTDFAMALYLPDGSPNSSFGGDGLNTTSVGGSDEIKATVLQPDDKILVAGVRGLNNNYNLTVARYLPDASLDNDFGTFFGVTHLDLGTKDDNVYDMVLLPDGKFVLAGSVGSGAAADMVLVQFQANGRPDSSFGTNGIVTTDFGGGTDIAYAIARQSDDKLLVAGRVYDNGTTLNENFGIARYLSNGTLDNDFGTGGKVMIKFTGFIEWASGLAVLPNDKILVTGHTQVAGFQAFALAQLMPDGTLDSDYGSGGKVTKSIPGYAFVSALAIQPDGKALLGGYGNGPFHLARFTADGLLDSTFTDGVSTPAGIVQTNFNGGFSQINALAMYPDGRLLAVGTDDNDFALARYITDGNVGIDHSPFEAGSVKIYPNPVEKQTTLSFTLRQPQAVQACLYNLQGQRIYRWEKQYYPAGNHSIDLPFPAEMAEGMYMLQVIAGEEISAVKIWK